MNFPFLSEQERIKKLEPPHKASHIVIDTDTFNEVDDQFAIAYALRSPERITVEAVYAAPFFNKKVSTPGEGMEKSYEEICRIFELLNKKTTGMVFKGSSSYLPGPETPVASEAAKDLVVKARSRTPEDPLYVVSIGAITNVASAILMDPSIIRNIVVVWLGGHPLYWPQTREFNLAQDIPASRIVLDCGVPLVRIPCMGVASNLVTTEFELKYYLAGKSPIGNFLYETVTNYSKGEKILCEYNHAMDVYLSGTSDYTDTAYADTLSEKSNAWSKIIWDISAVAYLVNPLWTPSTLNHNPVLTDLCTWSFDASRHMGRTVQFVKRDLIFGDLFSKLQQK
jgi:inosine-uridine nucleoside N-ribohydrolase